MTLIERQNGLLIYKDKDENVVADAIYRDETLWLTQKGMAKVFGVDRTVITKHLKKYLLMENWIKIQCVQILHILQKMEKHAKQIFII